MARSIITAFAAALLFGFGSSVPIFASEISTPIARINPLFAISQGREIARPNVPCRCRYQGADIELGSSVCFSTPQGMRRAVCSLVLNNTSWKMTQEPCAPIS